nr:T9SS type A sorting domain-containing protein [Bacteroidota bacterium]
AITFGYFPVSTSDTYLELGSLSKDQNNTLYPKFELEELLFEPVNSLFGLYLQNLQGSIYSNDALNLKKGNQPHLTRLYPIIDHDGSKIDNQYLLAYEVNSDGDYQDYVFMISNVIPMACTPRFEISIAEINQPDCEGEFGSVTFSTTSSNPFIKYTLGKIGIPQPSPIFNNLLPGEYQVYAYEEANHCWAMINFTILEPKNSIDFSFDIQPVTCGQTSDGSVKINSITGGSPPYKIFWRHQNQESQLVENLDPGVHQITVMDAENCKRSKLVVVNKSSECISNEVIFNFYATSNNQNFADLIWQTSSKAKIKEYMIERSGDKTFFEKIGNIEAIDNETSYHFQFSDPKPLYDITFYRLKYITIDGLEGYSNILSIRAESQKIHMYVYPNPNKFSYIILEMQGLTVNEKVNMKFVDSFGRNILSKYILANEKGNIKETLDLDLSLSSGIYHISIYSATKTFHKQVVVVTK